MSRRFWPCQAPGQAATAPSRMVSDGSGTRVCSVTWWIRPRPWHSRAGTDRGVRGERIGVESFGGPAGRCPPARRASAAGSTASSRCPPTTATIADPRRCCSATAGGSPVMSSTFGAPVGSSRPAGVWRDRLEVAALRLGVDRAESQRRLARPRDAGERDQGVARGGDVDAAQVVHPGAEDADERVDALRRCRLGHQQVAAHAGSLARVRPQRRDTAKNRPAWDDSKHRRTATHRLPVTRRGEDAKPEPVALDCPSTR